MHKISFIYLLYHMPQQEHLNNVKLQGLEVQKSTHLDQARLVVILAVLVNTLAEH